MIALLDLKQQNAKLQSEIDAALQRVAHSGRYILGAEVEAFEREWASYCGVRYCVGTGNALDALRLILMALGIGSGDEVIVASNTYIATWLAVSLVGARPVPVEPDPKTMNMDPRKVSEAITWRTAAIMPTHLYGACAATEELTRIAEKARVALVADAAQAHGATRQGRRAGGLCYAEAFSFYPSKNLGALGDAGCITTNDAQLAEKARRLRNYGGVGRLDHTVRGINSRMDELHAAVLRVKLPHLDAMNLRRSDIAAMYTHALSDCDLGLPLMGVGSCWHQYVIRSNKRDELAAALEVAGIEAHIHYPVPPHLEGAYADLGIKLGTLPIAETLGRQVLSLPIGYECNFEAVSNTIRKFFHD